jgi:hypothetical protein
MSNVAKDLRIRQTSIELTRLKAEVAAWQNRRIAADQHPDGGFRGQYQSQLARIVEELDGAAGAIQALLNTLSTNTGPALSLGALYQECARHDRRIIWLRRAWDFYREKFDQRDDPRLQACVRAADEVLWSCYKPFFSRTSRPLPPAPLPYVENTYSPTAVRADDSSHLEKSAEIEEGPLKAYFESLPVPLLQLPPASVTSPWTHVLIGHEAGHFIQDFALPDSGYRRVFREKIQQLAHAVAGEAHAQMWGRWASEIFADLYSVLTMGPAAVWTIAQFEMARPGKLTTRGSSYPSPLVRIHLLSAFVSRLGIPEPRPVLQNLEIDAGALAAGSAEVQNDLETADRVAVLILDPLPGAADRWPDVISSSAAEWSPGRGFDEPGEVLQWAQALRNKRRKTDDKTLVGARRVAAGTVQAWRDILAAPEGPVREESIRSLEANAFQRMIACAEPGTRAAGAASVPTDRLSRTLLAMNDEELFS